MTQEEKELLLRDLCARLPYGVKIMFSSNGFHWDWEQTLNDISQCEDGEYVINGWGIHGIKPYLRPMSSMTEEERKEFNSSCVIIYDEIKGKTILYTIETIDWLNAHHFDYRGLIEKGLALEAPEGMYNIKENNYGNN